MSAIRSGHDVLHFSRRLDVTKVNYLRILWLCKSGSKSILCVAHEIELSSLDTHINYYFTWSQVDLDSSFFFE